MAAGSSLMEGGQDEAGGETGDSAGSRSSGDFAFVGFYAEIANWAVPDCALVSAGALLEFVTLPENALVPPGAEITTQEDADTLELIGGAEEEFKEAALGSALRRANGVRCTLTCRASLLFCSSGEIMARSDVGAPREVEW
jgi:hypothetical protein